MSVDESYVTVAPTTDPHKFLVVVMVYRRGEDDYVQGRCSRPLPIVAAQSLAESWGAAMRMEIR